MTIRFVWIELSMLVYECCLSPSMLPTLPTLFNRILQFAFQSETDKKMGELLRILLPILSLFQEGKHMDEKSVRNSQRVLLAALTARDSRLNNAIFALIQRLIINMPDRVDDRKNTIECLMTLLLSRSDMEKRRIDAWILLCARCGIANIRLCAVSLARSLLMSRYVWARSEDGVKNAEDGVKNAEDGVKNAEDGIKNAEDGIKNAEDGVENNKEDNKNMDNHNTTTHQQDPSAMEIEPSPNSPSHQEEKMEEEYLPVQRELFAEEQPLCSRFFSIVLARCNDIVISIRAEAVHVFLLFSAHS